jgi:hypothetical protein
MLGLVDAQRARRKGVSFVQFIDRGNVDMSNRIGDILLLEVCAS